MPGTTTASPRVEHYVAFYASRLEDAYVDDEPVLPQQGDFYGGWTTRRIVGPSKGAAGTWGLMRTACGSGRQAPASAEPFRRERGWLAYASD